MKTQRNFKCKECGIFSVAYDTRDRRLFKIFPCKCGKVEVSARGVDSFAIFKETILLKISCKRKSTQPWNTIQKTTLRFQGKFGA